MSGLLTTFLRKINTARHLTWAQRKRRIAQMLYSVGRPIFFVIYYPGARLLSLSGVRFLVLSSGKIPYGHLAHDPRIYIQGEAVGAHPSYRAVLLAPRWKAVNTALVQYWGQQFTVIVNPVLAALLIPFTWIRCVSYNTHFDNLEIRDLDGHRLISGPATDEILKRYAEEHSTGPPVTVRAHDERRGIAALQKFGLEEDDWWVCLHARESGYYASKGAATKFRNTDPGSYLLAVQAIVDRGGWVIRIGDPSMTPLPPMEHVIDYVHTDLRADWLELFLIGKCKFLLASNSGPNAVAWMFGRPVAAANLIPMSHGSLGLPDIYIPKLYRSVSDQRNLQFSEVLLTDRRDFYTDSAFETDGLEWRDNTPEEIRELALEMLDKCDGTVDYTPDDDRAQESFWNLWEQNITTFSFGRRSRVGRDFLRRHAALLEPDDDR